MPSQSHWSEALYAELQSIAEEQVEVDHSVSPKRKSGKYHTIYEKVLDSKPKQNEQVRQDIESDFISNTRTCANADANPNQKEYDHNKENLSRGGKKFERKDVRGRVGHACSLENRRKKLPSSCLNKNSSATISIGGSRGVSIRPSINNQRYKQKSQKTARTREPKNDPPKNNRGYRRDHSNDPSKSKSASNETRKVRTLKKRIDISPELPALTTRGRIRRSVRQFIKGTLSSEETPEGTDSIFLATPDTGSDAIALPTVAGEDGSQMEPIIEERSNEEPLYKVIVARPISSSSSLGGHTFSGESRMSSFSSSFDQTGTLNALPVQERNFSSVSHSEIENECQNGMSNASTSMDPAIHALNSFDALSVSQEYVGSESQTNLTSSQSQLNSSMISSIVNDEQSYMNLDTDASSFAFSANTSATSSMYQMKEMDRPTQSLSLGSIYDLDTKGESNVYTYPLRTSSDIDSRRSLKAEEKSHNVGNLLPSSSEHCYASPGRDVKMKESAPIDLHHSQHLRVSSEVLSAEMPNTNSTSHWDEWKEESFNMLDRRQQWHASVAKREIVSHRQADFSRGDISMVHPLNNPELQQDSLKIVDRRNQLHIDEMKRELETSRTTLDDTDALLSGSLGDFTH